MILRKFVWAAFFSVSLLSAPVASTAQDTGGDENHVRKGKELAERLCASCHAVGKTDESPLKDAPPFRDFAKRWPLENLEEALAEGIVTGHPDMPAFVFEPSDIAHLIEYLSSLSDDEY